LSTGALDRRLTITVIEPWDFVTEHGSGPFTGTIVAAQAEPSTRSFELLIRMDAPIRQRGSTWSFFVARSTSEGMDPSRVREGLKVVCALTSITDQRALSPTPFAAIEYVNGLKLLADLAVV
jgi:hypothetical protein